MLVHNKYAYEMQSVRVYVNLHYEWILSVRFQCFQIGEHCMVEYVQIYLDMMYVTTDERYIIISQFFLHSFILKLTIEIRYMFGVAVVPPN